jgi:hypothetical protein
LFGDAMNVTARYHHHYHHHNYHHHYHHHHHHHYHHHYHHHHYHHHHHRMETTGEVDKVHISEELATELTKLQNYYLNNIKTIQREKIDVKGKGLMQTYWLESTDIDLLMEKYKDKIEIATKIIFEDDHDSYRPLYQFEDKHMQLERLLNRNDTTYDDLSSLLETDDIEAQNLEKIHCDYKIDEDHDHYGIQIV